jgi:hypothetical protein
LFFLLPFLSPAQEMYRTMKGKVEIRGEGPVGPLVARSSDLVMRVDHDTGAVYMNLDQSTLRTGNDSLDRVLERRMEDRIRFEGELEGGAFDPNFCYSSTPFRVDGILSYGGREERIRGEGEFRSRVSNDRIPCLLEVRFEMELKGEEWKGFLPGFEEGIRIRILQSVLNPGK